MCLDCLLANRSHVCVLSSQPMTSQSPQACNLAACRSKAAWWSPFLHACLPGFLLSSWDVCVHLLAAVGGGPLCSHLSHLEASCSMSDMGLCWKQLFLATSSLSPRARAHLAFPSAPHSVTTAAATCAGIRAQAGGGLGSGTGWTWWLSLPQAGSVLGHLVDNLQGTSPGTEHPSM